MVASANVRFRLPKVDDGGMLQLPLTERVSFKTRLQIGNRVQVPKYFRWHYKLETNQILEVSIKFHNNFHFAEIFLSRISKDGRIVIPKLAITILKNHKPNLDKHVAQVMLDPL